MEMIELTNSDREIVRLISEADDSGVQIELLHDCYARGIAAGIERAAKVCDNVSWEHERHDQWHAGFEDACYKCAAAIRALLR